VVWCRCRCWVRSGCDSLRLSMHLAAATNSSVQDSRSSLLRGCASVWPFARRRNLQPHLDSRICTGLFETVAFEGSCRIQHLTVHLPAGARRWAPFEWRCWISSLPLTDTPNRPLPLIEDIVSLLSRHRFCSSRLIAGQADLRNLRSHWSSFESAAARNGEKASDRLHPNLPRI
jgi:hypothetical protein